VPDKVATLGRRVEGRQRSVVSVQPAEGKASSGKTPEPDGHPFTPRGCERAPDISVEKFYMCFKGQKKVTLN